MILPNKDEIIAVLLKAKSDIARLRAENERLKEESHGALVTLSLVVKKVGGQVVLTLKDREFTNLQVVAKTDLEDNLTLMVGDSNGERNETGQRG